PGKVSFQVAENIARAKPLVFDVAARFDSNELFPRSRIAHAECCSNRGSPNEGADLENIARANFCEMINENQHVQMQHGIFVADFQQLRMNRLLPGFHQQIHQALAIAKLITDWRQHQRFRERLGERWTMLAHHHEIALGAIELRDTREKTPAFKAEMLK